MKAVIRKGVNVLNVVLVLQILQNLERDLLRDEALTVNHQLQHLLQVGSFFLDALHDVLQVNHLTLGQHVLLELHGS